MLTTSLLSLLLFLSHRASSFPIETCEEQIPCLSVEYEEIPGDPDQVRICMVYDDSLPECIKDGDISFACPDGAGYPFPKIEGFGTIQEEDCGDNVNGRLCIKAQCVKRDGVTPIPAKRRFVEFGFKDGRGCAASDPNPSCTFCEQDCSLMTAGDPCIQCDTDCCDKFGLPAGCVEDNCCSVEPVDICENNDDPTFQHQCRPATGGGPPGPPCDPSDDECDVLCAGGNQQECIHRIYYDCPEDCDTRAPTNAPTDIPTVQPPPCEPNQGINTCPDQDHCFELTLDTSSLPEVTLIIDYDRGREGCCADGPPSNVCFEDLSPVCDCDGDPDTPNPIEPTVCDFDTEKDIDNCWNYEPDKGLGHADSEDVFKLEGIDNDAFTVTLTSSCGDPNDFSIDPYDLHFHYSAKDGPGCGGTQSVRVIDGGIGSEICIDVTRAGSDFDDFCQGDGEGGDECLRTAHFCRVCAQYEADTDWAAACDEALAITNPHSHEACGGPLDIECILGQTCESTTTNPDDGCEYGVDAGCWGVCVDDTSPAMLNEGENQENVFGLKHASKSETAGLLSVVVIAASVISMIAALSIYKYVVKKRADLENRLVDPQKVPPSTPTSPVSEESNESQQNIEEVEDAENGKVTTIQVENE